VVIIRRFRTRYWKVSPFAPDPAAIRQAASIVAGGGVVAFPTETVYGLGADTLNPLAVGKIFTAKGRPVDNPLIVHVAELRQVWDIVLDFPAAARLLAANFWPGPLTLVLPKRSTVPDAVTGGLDTVAVRMPRHRVALDLIKKSGCSIAAPSANLSGKPSPTTARHVLRDLYGRVDGIIDGGPAVVGLESTVLDLTGPKPLILRPGGVTREQLEREIGPVDVETQGEREGAKLAPRSPGMKYRHYSPEGNVILIHGERGRVVSRICELAAEWNGRGQRVAVLCSRETYSLYSKGTCSYDYLENIGSQYNLDDVARNLYGALHTCDQKEIDIILIEVFPATGLGAAIMNRLQKAAGSIMEII